MPSAHENEIAIIKERLEMLTSGPGLEDVGLVQELKQRIEIIEDYLKSHKSVAEQRAEAGAPVGRSAGERQTTDASTTEKRGPGRPRKEESKPSDVEGSGGVSLPKPESKG